MSSIKLMKNEKKKLYLDQFQIEENRLKAFYMLEIKDIIYFGLSIITPTLSAVGVIIRLFVGG